MKTIVKADRILATVGLILTTILPNNILAQTTMSILPVNSIAVNSQLLNAQQWQGISYQLQDHFVAQLASIGTISKLSREHILLLMKEMPSPDPENLTAEAYKIISKKENLHYLLKCSIESVQLVDKNVLAPIRIIIVDGNNGKVFWEKTVRINKIVSNSAITEHILLNEVFKPSINEISKEIRLLKY
jgi:hypothetical protein